MQEKTIQRVGGDGPIPVDVRVLAATNRNLEQHIQEQRFREDLFYRISVLTIRLPPLRERLEDIPALVRFFLGRYARELGVEGPSIQPEAVQWLQAQPWPGNVRELENVVCQALLASRHFTISVSQVKEILAKAQRPAESSRRTHAAYIAQLLERVQRGEEHDAYARMIADLEPELFRQAVQLAGGNQAKAARWLGVTRLKMREKLLQLGLLAGRPNLE